MSLRPSPATTRRARARGYGAAGLAAALALTLLACGGRKDDKERAQISCVGEVERIRCDVKHAAGPRAVRVCWDLELTCKNGKRLVERFCEEVQPTKATTKRIRTDEIMGYDACKDDGADITGILNTRVSAL